MSATVATLAPFVLSLMTFQSPPEQAVLVPTYLTARETAEERMNRYRDIADVIARTVVDEPKPLSAAILMVAVAYGESGFARDVDLGPCDPGRLKKGYCDGGAAIGLWQLQYRIHGLSRAAKREDQARKAWALIKSSLTSCRKLPMPERLAQYARGNCTNPMGRKLSRDRWAIATHLGI